ncbi:MAG: hypothetical protein J6F30_14125 [Cellulosilyticum sp.]|nr:hypothetical protein [Cellulosilyticum sp.]
MRRKLMSVLLAVSIMAQGSTVWAIDSEMTSSTEQIQTQEIENQEQEETKEENIITESSVASKISDQVISGDIFTFTIDSKKYYKNGNKYILTAEPISIEGRNYLPVRFVAETVLEGSMSFNQGKIEITKGDMTLQMVVDRNKANLNGQEVTLEGKPIVKNNTTYIPVKVLSDYFDFKVDYTSQTKQVKLIGPDKGINTAPIAQFNFGQTTYTEGQSVNATNISYDPDGHHLKDKMWCLINGQQSTMNKELSHIFKSPKAGVYTIGLRVQDQYGLWSEWSYKDITILPNEVPKITYLGTDKNTYAQGETITYQYFYDNEPWEKVINEKWTYRHADEDESKAILGKPNALFTEGDYIIALQVDDAFGNRSEVYETTITITEQVLSTELQFRFNHGKIGDIIDNYQGFNYRDYDDANIVSTSLVAGRMIMSDSPEEVKREGILYRDSINGKGRLLIHHINKFSDSSVASGTKRVVIVAENKTDKPITMTLGNKTIKGPVTDILYLGQKLLYDYLVGSQDEVITLQPGEKQYIYDSGTRWKQETCISGLMDIETTGDVTFTMAAVSAGSTLDSMTGMELFLQAVHPRGTFEGTGIKYNLILDETKPTKIVLGNGQEEWVKGYDALTHDEAFNKGNYGVSYYITITATEDTGIILNPRANVFRGAVKWKGEGVYNVPNTGTIFNNTAKAVSLGTIKAGETKTLEYMLPNGSSAPVVLAFIPSSYWDN